MLNINKCKLIEQYVNELHSEVGMFEEGAALVAVLEDGVEKVRPSAAAANQVFVGVAHGRTGTPTNVPFVETFTAPAASPYTVTLSRPMAGTEIRVTSIAADGTRTAQTAGTPASTANQYSISNGVITLHSGQAEKTIEVAYRHNITLQEAIYMYNFHQNGMHNTSDIGTIGVVNTGFIYTDMYDVTSDWAGFDGQTDVYITEGGRFTLTSTSNTMINNVRVVQVPSAGDMFLGLYIDGR